MSWETVNVAIKFWSPDVFWGSPENSEIEFTPDEQNEIREALHQLYVGSSFARALLEGAVSSGQNLNFYQLPPGDPGETIAGSGIVGLNLPAIRHSFMRLR